MFVNSSINLIFGITNKWIAMDIKEHVQQSFANESTCWATKCSPRRRGYCEVQVTHQSSNTRTSLEKLCIWLPSTKCRSECKGTDNFFLVNKGGIPRDRMEYVNYAQYVCNICPEKEEKNRTRCLVGGNTISYPRDVGTPTADMMLLKILFNGIISTKGDIFVTADIINFYLMAPLKRWEYIKLYFSVVPEN